MSRIPIQTRKYVRKRDKNTCFYCGVKSTKITIDHVIPKSKGGTDDPDNLVCACERCNQLKADMDLNEFYNLLIEHDRILAAHT